MSPKARWIVAAGLLIVVAAAILARSGKSGGWKPPESDLSREDASKLPSRVLKFLPESLDFGEILTGQKKTLTLGVHNPGSRAVTIFRVIFSCTCMSGGVEQLVVPPGEGARIPVSFTGLPGKRIWSAFASVITDEPGASKYEIALLGKVQRDFVVDPEILVFGQVEREKTRAMTATVRRRDGSEFAIREVKAARPEFTFTWKPDGEGKAASYELTATAKALVAGSLAETVRVVTDPGLDGSTLIVVTLEVHSEVTCTPPVVNGTGATSFETILRHKTGAAIQVENVKESRDVPIAFATTSAEDNGLRLMITFQEGLPVGPPLGEFLINVTGEQEPVRLPYRVEGSAAKSPGNP